MTNKEVIRAYYEAAYNQKDYKSAIKYLAPSYFDHSPAAAKDSADAIATISIVHQVFPDLKVEVVELIEENDLIAGQFFFTGTQKKDYLGVKATGKTVSWEAVEIFRMGSAGRIVESWGYWPDAEIRKSLLEAA